MRGTTEGINLVAQTYGRQNVQAGDEVLITGHGASLEHRALADAVRGEKRRLRVAPINDRGELILEEFEKLLNDRTRLVAITHVSNALGTINPVRQIVAMAHAQERSSARGWRASRAAHEG